MNISIFRIFWALQHRWREIYVTQWCKTAIIGIFWCSLLGGSLWNEQILTKHLGYISQKLQIWKLFLMALKSVNIRWSSFNSVSNCELGYNTKDLILYLCLFQVISIPYFRYQFCICLISHYANFIFIYVRNNHSFKNVIGLK